METVHNLLVEQEAGAIRRAFYETRCWYGRRHNHVIIL